MLPSTSIVSGQMLLSIRTVSMLLSTSIVSNLRFMLFYVVVQSPRAHATCLSPWVRPPRGTSSHGYCDGICGAIGSRLSACRVRPQASSRCISRHVLCMIHMIFIVEDSPTILPSSRKGHSLANRLAHRHPSISPSITPPITPSIK